MDKCPYCGSETRPGDNFCLSCGHRLTPSSPNDATIPAQDDWMAALQSAPAAIPASSNPWEAGTIAATPGTSGGEMTIRPDAAAPVVSVATTIEKPGRLVLRADKGEILNEYPLGKLEIAIGRAPNSDILLSKDKLTSRRHATIRYENGNYVLYDERSANGTFINGQQIEDVHILQEGDLIGIGEHELVFHKFEDIADMRTVVTSLEQQSYPTDLTYGTRDYGTVTSGQNGYSTQETANENETAVASEAAQEVVEVVESPVPVTPKPEEVAVEVVASSAVVTTTSVISEPLVVDNSVNFNRLTSFPQPSLPDIAPLMAALATLDGQVTSLQDQLNATQEAMRNHESDIAQTSNQLRAGVRRVAERMDSTIADVARSREALSWAELLQLMEDVMNNPRDIEYVTKLARKARELNKVFQIHQNVLSTLAECNSLLRGLISDK